MQEKLAKWRGINLFFRTSLSFAGAGLALLLLLVLFTILPHFTEKNPSVGSTTTPMRTSESGVKPTQSTETAGQGPVKNADSSRQTAVSNGRSPHTTSRPGLTFTPVAPLSLAIPAVLVEGQTAFVGIGSRLAVVDISHPDTPQQIGQSDELPGQVLKVLSLPNGSSLRVAASAGRYLAVVDASNPQTLSLTNQSKLPGPITALILDLSTKTLYAGGTLQGDASKGFISRLDASQPDGLQLLDTIQLPAPVQCLASSGSTLYAGLKGNQPGITAIPLNHGKFDAPQEVLPNVAAASMTVVGESLYLGTSGQLLAYDLTQPEKPQLTWKIEQVGGAPIPGTILGFEIRPYAIFVAGRDASGQPFHLGIHPPSSLQTGSMVDTASYISVSAGQMLVAGDSLEIYDSRDSQNLVRLGVFPLKQP